MEIQPEMKSKSSKRYKRKWSTGVSFSARLAHDVRGVFADSISAVKYSTNPFLDIRKSIIEMIQCIGVQDWKDMEELIYCYTVLNSSDLRNVIEDAFLSIFFGSREQ